MNPVIAPGDRVVVEMTRKGYSAGHQTGTVLALTVRGNIKIMFDGTESPRDVPAKRVKKIVDET